MKTTQPEATMVEIALRQMLKPYLWFKRTALDQDDTGYCVNLYIEAAVMKANGGDVPRELNGVKIVVFNVG